jgi:hypothetical protein
MATVNKDFRVKHGLIVEGENGTINGSDIITEDAIVGGTQTNITVTYNPTTKVVDFVAENGVSDSTTDDLAEGDDNLYFTDGRAKDSAADLLTSATLTNITITGTGTGLTITAENGVDDSTTDDLDEGATNLYYTDTRVRDAIAAGDGLDYNSTNGTFSANLGNGLQFDVNGQIEIDDNVVATDTDVSTAVGDHSDLTTGVHGVSGNVVGTDDVQTLENKVLGSGTTLGASIDAEGFTVTNLATPDQASDAATKGYVDGLAEGLSIKPAVIAATDENLSATYLNGTNGEGATLNLGPAETLTIGGINSWSLLDGILVKDQTNQFENGRYFVDQIGGASTDWILKRCTACDEADEIPSAYVFVQDGDYQGTGWVASVENPGSFEVGVDDIIWIQFSGAGTYSAGNGLTLDGTEFSIDTEITATNSYVDGAVDDHSDLTTGVHGVTGDVVGTSDTQTLTAKTLGTGTVLGADLDGVNTYKIVNLVDPSSAQDAVTKNYVDETFVTLEDLPGQLDDYIPLTQRGEADGVATLDEEGQVPVTQLGRVTEAIDGLTTADIEEDPDGTGTSGTLYFTDARAVDALEAVVPNFTAIEVNSVAKQVAATVSAPTAVETVAYAFSKEDYRSAKFLVKVAYSTHTEVSEVLLTLDTSDNIAITEFAIVSTNGSASAISAGIDYSNVELLVTPTNANSTITVVGTLLA